MNISKMIDDEIKAREKELREKFAEYQKDVGPTGENFYRWARMIIKIEEGLIE